MSHRQEGQRVPEATFRIHEDGAWRDLTTGELFGGKRVILFALPGAFTPTCSSAHLPRYEELTPVFREQGIDEVVCLSVNDAFVMNAWARDQGIRRVRMIPDGNGEFSEGMGMLVDKRELGFGPRSWRYAMLVDDGVIEKLLVEPEQPGDPYEVSDADTMLRHVAPNAEPGSTATLLAKEGCPHCARAKRALDAAGIPYEELVLGRDATMRSVEAMTGRRTVPQVWVDGAYVGDADAVVSCFGSV